MMREFANAIQAARQWLESDHPGARLPDDLGPLVARMVARTIEPGYDHSALHALPPRRVSAWPDLTEQASDWLRKNSESLQKELVRYAGHEVAEDSELLLARHQLRLAGMAADLLTSHPLAPPVRLSETTPPASSRKAWHVLIFETWAHVSHELWPPLVDAMEAGLRGMLSGQAVAAHTSWLDARSRLRRAMWYDPVADRLIESDLPRSQTIRSAHLLVGPPGQETAWHTSTASRLQEAGCSIMNPATVSELADDKWAMYECWRDTDVPTPRTWLIPRASTDTTAANLHGSVTIADAIAEAQSARLVIKPRYGTEGRSVSVFSVEEGPPKDALTAILRGETVPADDAVVQEHRNHLRWRSDDGAMLPATLRLHTALDGNGRVVIESGYVHVAREPNSHVASVGRGGRAAPVTRERLWLAPPDRESRALDSADIAHVVAVARNAATTVVCRPAHLPARSRDEAVRLMGMDLLVEAAADGRACAFALEVNPRPAGLGHSRFLMPDWREAGAPGVSVAVWEGRE